MTNYMKLFLLYVSDVSNVCVCLGIYVLMEGTADNRVCVERAKRCLSVSYSFKVVAIGPSQFLACSFSYTLIQGSWLYVKQIGLFLHLTLWLCQSSVKVCHNSTSGLGPFSGRSRAVLFLWGIRPSIIQYVHNSRFLVDCNCTVIAGTTFFFFFCSVCSYGLRN